MRLSWVTISRSSLSAARARCRACYSSVWLICLPRSCALSVIPSIIYLYPLISTTATILGQDDPVVTGQIADEASGPVSVRLGDPLSYGRSLCGSDLQC